MSTMFDFKYNIVLKVKKKAIEMNKVCSCTIYNDLNESDETNYQKRFI